MAERISRNMLTQLGAMQTKMTDKEMTDKIALIRDKIREVIKEHAEHPSLLYTALACEYWKTREYIVHSEGTAYTNAIDEDIQKQGRSQWKKSLSMAKKESLH